MILGIGDSGRSWRTTLFGSTSQTFMGAGITIIVAGEKWIGVAFVLFGCICGTIQAMMQKDKQITGVPGAVNTKDVAHTPLTETEITKL